MTDLRAVRLRSNPRLRLVAFDCLQGAERDAMQPLARDPEFFGVLVPPDGSALPAKSVSREAALLFLALREPAKLPHLLDGLFGIHVDDRLRPLILDGVFELERDGQFLSGAAALPGHGTQAPAPGDSRLALLCTDAIEYAAALHPLPVRDVAARLYSFNTAPATRALQRLFAIDERVLAYLLPSSEVAQFVRSRWQGGAVADGWLSWSGAWSSARLGYKLYVSPQLEHLPGVFAAAVEAFAKTGCAHFKVGRGAWGLLRPDKLVAYFDGLDRLRDAAGMIQESASGVAAQGVPFTAPIDPDGLLSWGMDPPRFEQVLASQQYQSWRQWLTGRIAVYARAAREDGGDVLSFVRERIELDGVDAVHWSPDLAIWRGPTGTEQEAL